MAGPVDMMTKPEGTRARLAARIIAALPLIVAGMTALAPVARSQSAPVSGSCKQGRTNEFLDLNNVRAEVGQYQWQLHDLEIPPYSGRRSGETSGVQVGGFVNGQLRTAIGDALELWPGPLGPGATLPDPVNCSKYDRVYEITWSDVIAYDRDGLITPNLQYWPWQMGAPVVDGDGNPDNYDLAAGDRPELLGHQRLWWVMNDVGNRHANSRTDPLGIEVHLSAIAASSVNPHIDNTAFFTYRVINRSSTRIDSAFFVPIRPGPLGGGRDDYAGIDTSLGLAYSYNADNDDGGYPEIGAYGIAPPAVGVMLLEGSPSAADHMDNDYDKSIDEAGEEAGIGHFMVRYEWGFSSGDEYYNLMNGRFGHGSPIRQGGDGRGSGTESRHHYPGDPVVPLFWSERRSTASGGSNRPGERSWSLSFGPFVLEPGGEVEFATAMVWARGSDHIDSVVQLREAAVDVRQAWFAGLPVNEPLAPESAELVAPADDAEGQPAWLTLWWQRSSERDLSRVQVATDAQFEDVIIDRLLHADQTGVTLDLGRRYWWRVAAAKQTYSGTWSEPRSLSTGVHDLVPFIPPTDFAVTANAAGPIEPPECGAFGFLGAEFPMSCGANQGTPGRQQATSNAVWGIHSAYSSGRFGPYDEPRTFLAYYAHFTDVGEALASAGNIEFRFTDDGGLARHGFHGFETINVPFEVWETGHEIPNDPVNDVRLIPRVLQESPGSAFDLYGDHEVSDGDDDPFTDRIDAFRPMDMTAGDSGYRSYFQNGGSTDTGQEIIGNLVFVLLNGGSAPPYVAELPEPGTVFRITGGLPQAPIPSAPASGSSIIGDTGGFFWQTQLGRPARLQFSTDPDFRTVSVQLDDVMPGTQVQMPYPGKYWWRVTDFLGAVSVPQAVEFVFSVPVEMGSDLPTEIALRSVYPNPFSTSTRVSVDLPDAGRVTLRLYDVTGRLVSRIAESSLHPAGTHEFRLDGSSLPSGVYLLDMLAGEVRLSRTVVVVH